MKAVQISDYGSNEVVELVDAKIPQAAAGEVLVKIHTAGINPIDWKIRGGVGKRLGFVLPVILGGEVAGVIEKVSEGVTDFKVGDKIYGMVSHGGFAEYVVAKTSDIALIPKGLEFVPAAAIPLGGLTGWQAMFDLAHLNAGQKILITGASGAVGSLAVQFAKAKGAYVIGTASGKNEKFVKSLGADEFINYETQKFEELVKNVDVVFDTVGGKTFEKSFSVIKIDGVVVTSVAFPSEEQSKKAKRVFCKPNGKQLEEISKLFEAGELEARISKVLKLEDIKEALALSESGKANGKIVLEIHS